MLVEDIGNATIRFFELLHSASSTLQQIRKQKYNDLVAADCSNVDPALLPPSPKGVFHHGLRVYHQIQIWKQLSDAEKDLLRWGVGGGGGGLGGLTLKPVHLSCSK